MDNIRENIAEYECNVKRMKEHMLLLDKMIKVARVSGTPTKELLDRRYLLSMEVDESHYILSIMRPYA